jgi:phosphoribosylcarboxyaminoimidazole (NCAIR) mutase
MGSHGDLPTMHTAVGRYIATFLYIRQGRRHCFGTPHHRTNECPYARTASDRGRSTCVIVAGAGIAAHLRGKVADGHDTSTRHWCNLSRPRHCLG